MAKTNNASKVIKRENWVSNFTLIGKPKINDYTFKIDEISEKSNWRYSSLNIGIDCGETYGVVYCEMMGGYSEEGNSVIYAHGKNDDGSDNFEEQIIVDWDDRNNEEILETIGDLSFITVGLEKTDKGKTFYKKFLSAYDAIAYIKEHIDEDTVVNVKGTLKYSTYNDKTQCKKVINSIALSKADDVSKYAARFTQSMLLDKDSASLKTVDKEKGIMYIDARVLDYVKEINGNEIKGQYPFPKQFEYIFPDLSNAEQCKKIMDKLFKVKKGITQATFEGDLIEGGAVVTATLDDIPDDIKELIECGVFTEEEALVKCSSNGNREQRMVIRKPMIRLVGDDKQPVAQIFPEKYTEEDLVFDFNNSQEVKKAESGTMATVATSDDMSWLDNL